MLRTKLRDKFLKKIRVMKSKQITKREYDSNLDEKNICDNKDILENC